MAAEGVDEAGTGSEISAKMPLKRCFDDHLADCPENLDGDSYPSSKRSRLDDRRCCDSNMPHMCGPSHVTKQSGSQETNEDALEDTEDTNDENLFNEISSFFDFRSSSALAAMMWIERRMGSGHNPRSILKNMSVDEKDIPADLDDATLWKFIASCVSDPPRRTRLENISTYEDVVDLIKKSSKIVVLTGAGVSVSCGIPDFRSRNGIYARLSVDYPDLPDPQAMFDIGYFKKNPKPFFKFAKEIYPGQFHPSISHFFIGALEKSGKLLRNYTQNIDTLEPSAGITRVIQCHGSFSTATCMMCKYKVNSDAIRGDVMNQVVPRCPQCPPESEFPVLKPDIVFFGESLPDEFQQFEIDKEECDLLIVMGSSLIVRPVAIIPNVVPSHVPQVLINREPLPHMNFDVELLGDCDVIIQHLCKSLGEPFADVLKISNTRQPRETSQDSENDTIMPKETSDVVGGVSEKILNENCCSDMTSDTQELSPTKDLPVESEKVKMQDSKMDTIVTESSFIPESVEDTLDNNANVDNSSSQENKEIEPDEKNSIDHNSTEEDIDADKPVKVKKFIDVVQLLDGQDYVCLAPSRYVFHGAEICEKDRNSPSFSDWDSDDDSDDSGDKNESESNDWDESMKLLDNFENDENEASTEKQEKPICSHGTPTRTPAPEPHEPPSCDETIPQHPDDKM